MSFIFYIAMLAKKRISSRNWTKRKPISGS